MCIRDRSSGPSFSGSDQGSSQGSLKVSETATYIGMYILEQSAIDAGGVSNQAIASASTPQSVPVTDTSDDPTTGAANDPTVTTITGSPSIEVTKTATVNDTNGDGKTGPSDYIYYTIKIENKGNVTLTGLTISDTLTDGNGGSLTLNNGPSYDSTTLGSSPGTLKVGEIQTYTALYVITAGVVRTPSIINSAIATASSTSVLVSDTSDDGNDDDGNTVDDPTVVNISPDPSIEAVKTATVSDVNANTLNDPGDIITYTIVVVNTGNVTLTSINLADTMTDNNGNALSLDGGPTFVSSSGSSAAGTLASAESATYTASYTIAPGAAFSGAIKNRVLVTGSSPGNTGDVTDFSDNGNDNDGNIYNDFTVVETSAEASINVIKSATVSDVNANSLTDAGDIITYSIVVSNTGGVPVEQLSLNDSLKDGNNAALTLDSGPTFVSATTSSTSSTLAIGGVASFTAQYTIGLEASYTGSIKNQVVATAKIQGTNTNVTDTSDDPNTAAANDQTIVTIDPSPSLQVTKTAQVTDEGDGYIGKGDVINYTITVKNNGNVTLTGLTISDTLSLIHI